MGLDMYLRASKYVSGYEHQDAEHRAEYDHLVKQFGVMDYISSDAPSGNVEFVVAYWRKVNSVHQWFVDNCQDGRDECQRAYVSREQLEELRRTCLRILELPTEEKEREVSRITSEGELEKAHESAVVLTTASARRAAKLLPTQSGFFFGDTSYDGWYREDIEDTVKQLDRVLSMPDDWEFTYQSSW